MITKNLWVAAAVTAMLGATSAAKADDTTTMTTTTTSVNVPDISFPGADVPLSSYALLGNPTFDGVDISQARAEGYSDRDIAAIAKIAHYSGLTFGEVKARIVNGATYYQVARENGVPEWDLFKVDTWESRVTAYRQAWDHTGRKSQRELISASEQTYTAPATTTTTTTNSWTTTSPSTQLSAPGTYNFLNNTPAPTPGSIAPQGTDNRTTPNNNMSSPPMTTTPSMNNNTTAPNTNMSAPPTTTTPDNTTTAPMNTAPTTP